MSIVNIDTGMLEAFKQSIQQDIPAGIVQDYWKWSLSGRNPDLSLWIKTIGIPQFDMLTAYMLKDTVEYDAAKSLQNFTSVMNVYLLYETISDNLAIGCARASGENSAESQIRREVVIEFNDAMIAKLENPHLSVLALPGHIRSKVETLSLFEHSLSYEKQNQIAQNFCTYRTDASVADIEFGGWEMLVANIEAASTVLEHLAQNAAYPLLQYNLIRRYDAVNQLLYHSNHELDTLFDIGTSTILVPAVLAYYFAVLAEIKENERLAKVIENGLVQQIFDDAALMIRLLNDIGPAFLRDTQLAINLTDELHQLYDSDQSQQLDIFQLLSTVATQTPELTRIHKDLVFDEFNILLDSLTGYNTSEAIDYTGYVLESAADTYARLENRLMHNIEILNEALDDKSYGQLALRFVHFHEKMYSNAHHKNTGEYAV